MRLSPSLLELSPFLPQEIVTAPALSLLASGLIVIACCLIFGINCYAVMTLHMPAYWRRLYLFIGTFVLLVGIPYSLDILIRLYWLDPLVFDLERWRSIVAILIASIGILAAGRYIFLPTQLRRYEEEQKEALNKAEWGIRSHYEELLEEKVQQLQEENIKRQVAERDLREYLNIVAGQREMIKDSMLKMLAIRGEREELIDTSLMMLFNDLHRRMLRVDPVGLPTFEEVHADLRQVQTYEHYAGELLQTFVDQLRECFVLVDKNGLIQVVNNACVIISGYAREELLSQPVEILVPSEKQNAHRQYRERYMQTGPTPRVMAEGLRIYLRQKSGAEVPITAQLYPHGDDAQFTFVLATLTC